MSLLGAFFGDKSRMIRPEEALPGRATAIERPGRHFVFHTPLDLDLDGKGVALFGMGCFWGAERKFWVAPGVLSTAVGYSAGLTPNPTYREVCTGKTGHNEVVRVVWDPSVTSFEALLKIFWESHDPTQGMRQGNDVGTQYRSGIYTTSEAQRVEAEASRSAFGAALKRSGYGAITTEIVAATPFYFAEDPHQQYLAKNPGGYCGLGGTGVSCPIGLAGSAAGG